MIAHRTDCQTPEPTAFTRKEGTVALPKLLDFPEVAEILGCSRPHAYDLAAAGELGELVNVSLKTSSTKTRVTEDGVAAFIERRKRAVGTPTAA
jgi:predicted DNA-binding transcriptional regulator AlpA